MTTGLLYDVHGNLPALEAVLADASGVDRWILGGDYSAFGAWPVESVERLGELPHAVWIRGNWERWQAEDAPDMPDPVRGAREAAREALGSDRVARLGALPATLDHAAGLVCHGSPGSDMDSFQPDPDPQDDERLAGVTARRVVFGHTHLAFARRHGAITLVNPGSVGLPFDGDTRAAWALLHGDGRVEHRRVAYDMEATAQALTARHGAAPWVQGTLHRLRTASF
jgi:diadenosine tetraphosphatase ApaH/serine/threonine PP2A family protein phosphatase